MIYVQKNHTNISGQKLYALRFGSPTWLADKNLPFHKKQFPDGTMWMFHLLPFEFFGVFLVVSGE